MPLKEMQPGDPKQGSTRIQIMGAPATYKTTVAATFDQPLIMVGMPGEKHTDIIQPCEGRKILLFGNPDYSNNNYNWQGLWKDIRVETNKIIAGEYGKPETVVFDGAHKAFYVATLAAKQKFAAGDNDWDGRRGWPWIHDEFLAWFSQAYYSGIPWVVWIVWSAKEQDDQLAPVNSEAAKKQSIWPEYSGKFQRTCMGETNIIYQYVEGGKAYWQIRQDEKVKGVGLRVAPERATTLPIRMEANWGKLKQLLMGGQDGNVSSHKA